MNSENVKKKKKKKKVESVEEKVQMLVRRELAGGAGVRGWDPRSAVATAEIPSRQASRVVAALPT